MVCTFAGDAGEGEAEALEVAERARLQQRRHVRVRRAHRQRQPPRASLRLLLTENKQTITVTIKVIDCRYDVGTHNKIKVIKIDSYLTKNLYYLYNEFESGEILLFRTDSACCLGVKGSDRRYNLF